MRCSWKMKVTWVYNMSIIKSNRFKNKLKFSTEPSQSLEQNQNQTTIQHKNKIQPSLRYQRDTSYHRQQDYTSEHQKGNFKPATSQIVFLDSDKLETKVGIFGKDGKKKRNFRQLKLQLPKQIIESKHLRQELRRSSSKEGQSSLDSVRIHKIRSNVGLEKLNKQYLINRQSFKPSRAYKCQQKKETIDSQKQKQKLIKTMLIEKGMNKMIVSKSSNKLKQIEKITEIKNEFYKLRSNIQNINKDCNVDNPYTCVSALLKDKSKTSAVRIIFRLFNKRDPRLLFWLQFIPEDCL